MIALLFVAALAASTVARPDPAAEQARFERGLFAEAGFQPIAEIEAEGREARRFLLSDPYMILPVPGIEIERSPGGAVTLRLRYRGWSAAPVPIDPAVWTTLRDQEAGLFAPHPPAPDATPGVDRGPPPICHGWIARYELGFGRSGSWAACGRGEEDAAFRYVRTAIDAALATRPDCAAKEGDPFWSFNACFAEKPQLDDARLEAKVAPIRRRFDDAPGVEALAAARTAVAAAGPPGSAEWIAARDAVERFAAVQDQRRAALSDLGRLRSEASGASDADRAKLRRLSTQWNEFIRSQQGNMIELLQRLVRPAAR